MRAGKVPVMRSDAFAAACQMPQGLKHWPDHSKPFELADSEVIMWLILEPEILRLCHEDFTLRKLN